MMDLTKPSVIKELVSRHGFTFTKSLGQNFITDGNVLERMIAAADIDGDTGVLEIGPGIGTLTQRLVRYGGGVAAVEIDDSLLPILAETLADYTNVQIYHNDALKLDIPSFCREALPYEKLAVCANLPYYITTQLVLKLLEAKCFRRLSLLLQQEAVERLCANPGDAQYCAASVIVRYYAQPKLLFRVPPNCFIPRPTVASAVLSLAPHGHIAPAREEAFFLRVVQAAFAQRRKTLVNTLAAGGICTKEEAASALGQLGFSPSLRGEALSAEDFAQLSKLLTK